MTNTIKFIQECVKNRQGLTIDVAGNMPEHKGYVISAPKYGKVFDLNKDNFDIVQLYKEYQNHFESSMYWFWFWCNKSVLRLFPRFIFFYPFPSPDTPAIS